MGYTIRHFIINVQIVASLLLGHAIATKAQKKFYARSIQELTLLAEKDLKVAKSFVGSSVLESPDLDPASERYLNDFIESHGYPNNTKLMVQEMTANPLAVYRLIRRATYLLHDVPGFSDRNLPGRQDLEDVMDAILRIQRVYNLSIAEFVNGYVRGVKTTTTLRAIHYYEIGNHAKSKELYAQAIQWLRQALDLALEDETTDTIMIKVAIVDAIQLHNENHARNGGPWSVNNFFRKFTSNLDWNRYIPTGRDALYNLYAGILADYWPPNYWALCSGADFRTENVKRHLFCWLEHKVHPIYMIGPLKMEFLARDPDVVQIYDVFTDSETQILKQEAGSLEPSMVVNLDDKNGRSQLSDHRTSAQAFLDDPDGTKEPMRKAGYITGLYTKRPTGSEETQVAAYTIGGHYEPHQDSLVHPHIWGPHGDRIATFMAYLNDVDQGGYTVFTDAFGTAVPVKGSAVFWFNLYSDGTSDPDTLHGACPVLMGHKWVANKWIRYNDQFLVRQCSLKPKQRYQIAVNGEYLPFPVNRETEYASAGSEEQSIFSANFSSKFPYSLIPGIQALARLEFHLYHQIAALTRQDSQDLQTSDSSCVKDYLEDFEKNTKMSADNGSILVDESQYVQAATSNALSIYKMYVRFEALIKGWILNTTDCNSSVLEEAVARIRAIYNSDDGPTEEDLEDAMQAIINLQFVYDLKAKDVADGKIHKISTNVKLKAWECSAIGHHAASIGYHFIAVDWAETALAKVEDGDDSVDLRTAERMLEEAIKNHDEKHADSEGWEPYYYYHQLEGLGTQTARNTRKLIQYSTFKRRKESNFVDINYWGICQGRPHQTPAEKSKLFCWYETEVHPTWKIGPLKAEILSTKPDIQIVQYHDVVQQSTIESLTNLSVASFMRAGVPDSMLPARNKEFLPYLRLSAISWIRNSEHGDLATKISRLAKRITGLKTAGKEDGDLQVASYTSGGHHGPHLDSSGYATNGRYSRIATFLIYLSGTNAGGATAFSQSGVHVRPKKGSAIFWYNLLSSGESDDYSWHGECPVISGTKWVATKWLKYHEQSHLQCLLNPTERYEILVNGKSEQI